MRQNNAAIAALFFCRIAALCEMIAALPDWRHFIAALPHYAK